MFSHKYSQVCPDNISSFGEKVAVPDTIDAVNYGDDVTNKTEHFNHYFQSIFSGTAAIAEDLRAILPTSNKWKT